MHETSMITMRKFVEDHGLAEGKVIVDVGSLDMNGTYRGLFNGSTYIGADIMGGPNVSVLVGSMGWDALKDVDAVISGQTFEHVEDVPMLLKQIHGILKDGGLLCVIAPSSGPIHSPPWYRIYSKESMTEVIEAAGFAVMSCTIDPGWEFHDCCCIAVKGAVSGQDKGEEKDDAPVYVADQPSRRKGHSEDL
jgi:SAM-dependent methyltransferase